MKKTGVYLFILPLFIFSCNIGKKTADNNFGTVTYRESSADFANPERGLYRAAFSHTSHFTPLDRNTLIRYRNGDTIVEDGHKVKIYSSLLQRVYILDNFRNCPISSDIFRKINQDFEIAREAGIKLIVRFNYTIKTHSGGCPEGFICPPYGDAPLPIVLEHISQLKPVFQKNADVIACVQEGFVGIWGESYYTDYFGDASSNGLGKYTDSNWMDRNKVLSALLDALPKDRMVQVRTPQLKQRYVYGVSASIHSQPLKESDAFNGHDNGRIGFHNDCFLDDPMSEGYGDRGNSQSPRKSDKETIHILKNYEKKESKFIVMGGETCTPNPPHSLCGSKGDAEKELAEFHYDFLNADYNGKVLGSWIDGGCFDKVKKKLGYRFVLMRAVFPVKISPGDDFIVNLYIVNEGYSSPFNYRTVQLVLRSVASTKIIKFHLNTDIRKWYPGEIKIKDTLHLPMNVPAGKYEMLLNLPDKYASISDRPEYSIRLANKNVWEVSTGYNNLNYSTEVE